MNELKTNQALLNSCVVTKRTWWLIGIGMGLVAILVALRTHFVWCVVWGDSMEPTFRTGDLLLVNKQAYQKAIPQRGDIVVANWRKELVVKRIVGLPGEELELKDGILYVNGTPLLENYLVKLAFTQIERGTLSSTKYALLGDNRSVSSQLIQSCIVSRDQLIGKAALRIPLRKGTVEAHQGD